MVQAFKMQLWRLFLLMSGGAIEIGEAKSLSLSSIPSPRGGRNRGLSILDFVFRVVAFVGTLGSAIAMGTTDETLPFFTQFVRFRAEYDDLPSFTFFVIANATVGGYLVLSLPLSIFNIVRSKAQTARVVLIIFDAESKSHVECNLAYIVLKNEAMLVLLTAGGSAATAVVYLAHKGNTRTNWLSICHQFNSFCQRTSASLIGSYIGVVMFGLIIFMAGLALSRR